MDKKSIVLGILAHVDAGKTTLSEGLLYASGTTDRLGRVDKRDAHLDTESEERRRGITIFSKQATLDTESTHLTLIDTPGHADFSAEAERALSVQDYAVLVISAPEGVQSHTKTLWRLLAARNIPTFIFINKCDISDRRRADLLAELKLSLSGGCVSFSAEGTPAFFEEAAACDEGLIKEYFENDSLQIRSIAEAIAARRIFPCIFGSALKMQGVSELLSVIDRYTLPQPYQGEVFGARVFKILRDGAGNRITFAKITGGTLRPKDSITYIDSRGAPHTEKVEQIRIFSADRSRPAQSAEPGCVAALYGLSATYPGMGLGMECSDTPLLSPVLDYRVKILSDIDTPLAYARLETLADEDPTLSLSFDERLGEIHIRLMGEIQLEVLEAIARERLGLELAFDTGSILYKETILDTVRGAGHFEPLRHYAEVHLVIEPLPEGSGIIAAAECDPDTLGRGWQRLVLTHIEERMHRGVLIGAPLADVKITLVAGRAHLKHTEGGDFRQATYRAVRQGLMKAESILLEPTFDFKIELPAGSLGRLMTDLSAMSAEFGSPDISGGWASLSGSCPVYTMRTYPSTLRAYTAGEGKIHLTPGAYRPAHNAEEIIAERGYSPELDERNPSSSVFCRGGAGYSVPWNEADEKMHISLRDRSSDEPRDTEPDGKRPVRQSAAADEKELMRIFEATYGKIKPRTVTERRESAAPAEKPRRPKRPEPPREEHLLIDGYNLIFADGAVTATSPDDLALSRDRLIRSVCNYAAFKRVKTTVVFDGHLRRGGEGSLERLGFVTVVYTEEGETADSYIERLTADEARHRRVRVVSSDLAEQNIILGLGALRVSVREFKAELEGTLKEMRDFLSAK